MLKRFIGRFFCLFFGHAPKPVTFTFPDGRPPEQGDMQIISLGGGPQVQAVCFNVCLRCDELARHRAREPIMTEKIRGMIEAEAKAKAEAEAAEKTKRLPGESLKAWGRRTKTAPKLSVVPTIQPQAPAEGPTKT